MKKNQKKNKKKRRGRRKKEEEEAGTRRKKKTEPEAEAEAKKYNGAEAPHKPNIGTFMVCFGCLRPILGDVRAP